MFVCYLKIIKIMELIVIVNIQVDYLWLKSILTVERVQMQPQQEKQTTVNTQILVRRQIAVKKHKLWPLNKL